jgi:hypothetical protein
LPLLSRLLAASLITCAALVGSAQASTVGLSFDGSFANGPYPWWNAGGQVQCANYGTASQSPRLRGNLYIDSANLVGGGTTGHFYLPTDTNKTTYPWEACDLTMGRLADTLPDDEYYGLMVYVPSGWTIPNQYFGGVNIYELHFQSIYGAPVTLELHPDHVTLALETGGCNSPGSSSQGCQYRSNADAKCVTWMWWTCLPGYYAIPPGSFVQGKWNEILLHAHWASDGTGVLQAWYRPLGSATWTLSATVNGIPSVQWNLSTGAAPTTYTNEIEAYTAGVSSPLNLWLDDQLISSSAVAVMSAMP